MQTLFVLGRQRSSKTGDGSMICPFSNSSGNFKLKPSYVQDYSKSTTKLMISKTSTSEPPITRDTIGHKN